MVLSEAQVSLKKSEINLTKPNSKEIVTIDMMSFCYMNRACDVKRTAWARLLAQRKILRWSGPELLWKAKIGLYTNFHALVTICSPQLAQLSY